MAITPRQSFLLRKLVEAHRDLDQPVGSKWIADQVDVPWGPSTVRAELARLEDIGLLEHPHTSAVRVPTDQPLGDLAILLLEPAAPDSFFAWGFFNEILQPTEYVEGYVIDLYRTDFEKLQPTSKGWFPTRITW